jgi:ABC-type phosphate/phosphonate transport system substrate-binding protein
LTAALFWQKSGTDGLHVPYKGGAPAISDLLAGQVDVSFQNINAVLQHIRSGKLRALAVTSDKRSAVLPNVPTMAEGGVKDVEVYSWQGVAAPKGLPADVKSRLHGAIVTALKDAKMQQKLNEQGFEVVGNSRAIRGVRDAGAQAVEDRDRAGQDHGRVVAEAAAHPAPQSVGVNSGSSMEVLAPPDGGAFAFRLRCAA